MILIMLPDIGQGNKHQYIFAEGSAEMENAPGFVCVSLALLFHLAV